MIVQIWSESTIQKDLLRPWKTNLEISKVMGLPPKSSNLDHVTWGFPILRTPSFYCWISRKQHVMLGGSWIPCYKFDDLSWDPYSSEGDWLVVSTPLKIFVSWDDDSQYLEKSKIFKNVPNHQPGNMKLQNGAQFHLIKLNELVCGQNQWGPISQLMTHQNNPGRTPKTQKIKAYGNGTSPINPW